MNADRHWGTRRVSPDIGFGLVHGRIRFVAVLTRTLARRSACSNSSYFSKRYAHIPEIKVFLLLFRKTKEDSFYFYARLSHGP
jgi:hypothetical protein